MSHELHRHTVTHGLAVLFDEIEQTIRQRLGSIAVAGLRDKERVLWFTQGIVTVGRVWSAGVLGDKEVLGHVKQMVRYGVEVCYFRQALSLDLQLVVEFLDGSHHLDVVVCGELRLLEARAVVVVVVVVPNVHVPVLAVGHVVVPRPDAHRAGSVLQLVHCVCGVLGIHLSDDADESHVRELDAVREVVPVVAAFQGRLVEHLDGHGNNELSGIVGFPLAAAAELGVVVVAVVATVVVEATVQMAARAPAVVSAVACSVTVRVESAHVCCLPITVLRGVLARSFQGVPMAAES